MLYHIKKQQRTISYRWRPCRLLRPEMEKWRVVADERASKYTALAVLIRPRVILAVAG